MQCYLVRGASAAAIEKSTGLRAIDTPLGALVEQPRPVPYRATMAHLERLLHPRTCHCVVVHMPPCREAYVCS